MDQSILERAADAIFLSTWRLQLTIPSVAAVGESFSLRLTAFGPDEIPSSAFGRTIRLAGTNVEGLPERVEFAEADCGCLRVDGLQSVETGHAFVTASIEKCPSPVNSNPAWIFDNPPWRIFWGDIHVHSTTSNCNRWACKEPAFCYAYARDATCLDFAGVADHLRGIASEDGRWAELQRMVREYDSPGRFVPFLGFESSHKTGFGGDINAYYLGSDGPYFWLDRDDMKGAGPAVTLQQLWDFLDATGQKYFTVPHHTGRAGKYRDFSQPVYDAEREPLLEIYSGWGSSESQISRYPLRCGNSDNPAYFQDALLQGCRYGVIASSDTHSTTPGGETGWRHPLSNKALGWHHHHGLAAVRSTELTRESLWEGLSARSCYATTFERALLDISIGDIQMGQAAPVGTGEGLRKQREIAVRYFTTDPDAVQLILLRNSEEIARTKWNPEEEHVSFTDEVLLDTIAVRDAQFHPEPFVVYYLRVEHMQGQTLWSSPIWLDLV